MDNYKHSYSKTKYSIPELVNPGLTRQFESQVTQSQAKIQLDKKIATKTLEFDFH